MGAGEAGTGRADPEQDPGGGAQPLNIYDVAGAAGVSYQTVSRVINGAPNVKHSTREHVLATITRLGYRPSRVARALAGGRVQSVTVLTSDTTLYGHRSVLQGIEEAARAADFAMGVRVIESEHPDAVRDAVDRSVLRGSALIVVAFDRAGTQALGAVPSGVPLVGIVETPTGDEGDGRPWVWIDDCQAAADATGYLLGLGHRTVHYVLDPAAVGRDPAPAGGLALGPGQGRGPGPGADPGRLAPAVGLHGRPVARRRSRGHRRALRQRRPRARRDQGDARGRPAPSPAASAWSASTTSPRRRF